MTFLGIDKEELVEFARKAVLIALAAFIVGILVILPFIIISIEGAPWYFIFSIPLCIGLIAGLCVFVANVWDWI